VQHGRLLHRKTKISLKKNHAIDRFNWHRRASHPVMKLLLSACHPPNLSAPLERSMSQPEPNVDELVKSIAEETDTPAETVSKMYADTLANYRHDARVFDYVPLFAAKKVRNQLRDSSNRKH
jgi:hypothetical protein